MKLDKSINIKTVNQNLLNIEYAVRGPILERALQIENELKKGYPFTRVVRANIGDCHALGQKPITFIRQVLAVAAYPHLLDSAEFPEDVKERARTLLGDCTSGSVGAYSPSLGLGVVRQHCAEFIARRDALPPDYSRVFLGSGASDVIKSVLRSMLQPVAGKPPAVMIPIPQYPLFSGTLSEFGFHQAGYFLCEERCWALESRELERCWQQASVAHHVRALVVINPGNPTGQVLSRENMKEIIKFAHAHNLFLMADEVYQENIVSKPFFSFKKVMHEMGAPYSSMELASFVTCSKGYVAECGLRSGYVELLNLDPDVEAALKVSLAVMQCPTVLGQLVMDCAVKPPQPGDPSYELFLKERTHIHDVLVDRSRMAYEAFNSIPGYFCNPIDGAMFAFPRIQLPDKAIEEANKLGLQPDTFYCLRLLEETGVCVVPGNGFGQAPGTYHFRTTILHPKEEFQHMLDCFRRFHLDFIREFQ